MTERYAIRPARDADLEAIRRCAHDAYRQYVTRIGRAPAPMIADFASHIANRQIHVIEVDGEVIGYVVFYARSDHLHLDNVAVRPEHTGRGFGRALIAFVEQYAAERGLAAVELYTNEKMHENVAMYPRLGYQEIDRRLEDGFDRVYFRKAL